MMNFLLGILGKIIQVIKMKIFLKTVIFSILCCAVFIGVGYFYLENEFKPIENKTESVPYYSLPDNTGLVFDICSHKSLFFLDFEQKVLSVIFSDDATEDFGYYGYSAEFVVEGDYAFVGGIVDLVGGIDYVSEEGEESLTGIQVEELLSTTPDLSEIRTLIIEQIASKISKNGFTKEDFLYIIENSNTDLTVPDCYYWSEYIEDMCFNLRFIN